MLYASVDDTEKLPKEFRIMIIMFVPYLVLKLSFILVLRTPLDPRNGFFTHESLFLNFFPHISKHIFLGIRFNTKSKPIRQVRKPKFNIMINESEFCL